MPDGRAGSPKRSLNPPPARPLGERSPRGRLRSRRSGTPAAARPAAERPVRRQGIVDDGPRPRPPDRSAASERGAGSPLLTNRPFILYAAHYGISSLG